MEENKVKHENDFVIYKTPRGEMVKFFMDSNNNNIIVESVETGKKSTQNIMKLEQVCMNSEKYLFPEYFI